VNPTAHTARSTLTDPPERPVTWSWAHGDPDITRQARERLEAGDYPPDPHDSTKELHS